MEIEEPLGYGYGGQGIFRVPTSESVDDGWQTTTVRPVATARVTQRM